MRRLLLTFVKAIPVPLLTVHSHTHRKDLYGICSMSVSSIKRKSSNGLPFVGRRRWVASCPAVLAFRVWLKQHRSWDPARALFESRILHRPTDRELHKHLKSPLSGDRK